MEAPFDRPFDKLMIPSNIEELMVPSDVGGLTAMSLSNGSAHLLEFSGFAGLFKTTSNLFVACGLIFKDLIGYLSMITYYSILGRKPLKIRPLLNQGAI
jgi:hypothetical protein